MKNLKITSAILFSLLFMLINSCETDDDSDTNTENIEEVKKINKTKVETKEKSIGYALMEKNCFVCHFAKPDKSKKSVMIAPPMLKVQEHYKPNYKTKEEFVRAISTWVNNPQEKNTLMPGAIRKFKVMPKLELEEEEIALIAETLFNTDFGDLPKMNKKNHSSLSLNNGEKWLIKAAAITKVNTISDQLDNFTSKDVKDYNKLGKNVFEEVKVLLLDKSYSEEIFEQLHNFFNDIETNMHNLIAVNSISEGEKELFLLQNKFNNFNNFFVSK